MMGFKIGMALLAVIIIGFAHSILFPTLKFIFKNLKATQSTSSKSLSRNSLESQIKKLDALGITLNENIGMEELLLSFDREEYESRPFDTILFMYGSEVEVEPWGRNFSDAVWNFDTECITGTGSYADVLTNIVRLTGRNNFVSDITDNFDFEKTRFKLDYILNKKRYSKTVKVNDDWVDPKFIEDFFSKVTQELDDGRSFWSIDNGQAGIFMFIDNGKAAELNYLTNNALIKN